MPPRPLRRLEPHLELVVLGRAPNHVDFEPRPAGARTAQLNLPLRGSEAVRWEVRACIAADGYLELSGREVMLLARLMDEFPLPEPEDREQQESLDHDEHAHRPPEDAGEQAIDFCAEIRCGGER